ncbi:DUF2977 domain-containing protein [Lactiplantibacillus plantarum]|uniref:DUF2977 domain-containing protein n=1 Tax=Lactiplantibacillus plantarum TaxID=1590 RepID=UPI0015EB6E5A|nr:DUF2977 domain-containing protein [Lactiplantibacillus plantarum]QLQ49143.1 DUF2977 domain-containing protein [Lactiplantibacillus plantarum]WDQ19939.1 DUF2977 domain-containing protein [Lactiplantibacillus plantarum]BEI53939.1 hypothetical protein AWA2045_20700 [Lactiplantibacillus plantarum]
MQLLVNDQQEITSYAIFGGLVGGIDYAGPIPDTFMVNFQSGRYLFQRNLIVVNPDYVVPRMPIAPTNPTTEQQLILQQATDMIKLKQMVMLQASQIKNLSKERIK